MGERREVREEAEEEDEGSWKERQVFKKNKTCIG